MKKIYLFILPIILFMYSCDLDTSPTTYISGDKLYENTQQGAVALNGLYRSMYRAGWSTDDSNTHQCFGISAYYLMADVMGEDMIMAAQGSGWFWFDCIYNMKHRYASKGWRSYDLWNAYYTWISNANYLIDAESTMEGTQAEIDYLVGQAYVIRGFSYYYAVMMFARTYVGHEDEPGIPIYTTGTTTETEGQPRSTVKQVYDQALNDINKGIELLENAPAKSHVSHIDYYVAQGLKSRICMSMNKWSEAADAARIARSKPSLTIGTSSELLGGMNDSSLSNVMWGAEIISSQIGQYASLFSHMDAKTPAILYADRAEKRMNKLLYDKMGETDIRRNWWLEDENLLQVKYAFSNPATWEGDYIWMRVEEMYLTEAEALCHMGNDAAARTILMEFMAYRDENYTVTKSGNALGALTTDETGSLLEEILIQKRIELWGEFGRIYDIKRLKQGFTRTTAMGWPSSALIEGTNTQNPETYAWVLTIPQAEFDGNDNMDINKDQNPYDDGI